MQKVEWEDVDKILEKPLGKTKGVDWDLKNRFLWEMSPELIEKSVGISQTTGQRHSRKKHQERNQNTDMNTCILCIKREKKCLSGG